MKYGICNLSVLPLRKAATHKSEMISQLLFGEVYEVLSVSDCEEWIEICNWADDYKGWLPKINLIKISESFYLKHINNAPHQYLYDIFGTISNWKKRENTPITIGAVLPFFSSKRRVFDLEEENKKENILLKRDIYQSLKETELERIAKSYLNTPYLWGGRSSFGIDCSAFVQQVYKLYNDVRLPRDASQQATVGTEIPFAERKKGDLAFLNNSEGVIDHVGLLLSENEIIHSSGKVRIDTFTEKGILNQETESYSHNFHHLMRVV